MSELGWDVIAEVGLYCMCNGFKQGNVMGYSYI